MITDSELTELFDKSADNFSGHADDLIKAFGVVVLGRLYGWRVARLVTTGKNWATVTKILGCDPRSLMPEHGKYEHKSVGLAIAIKLGGYWDKVRGMALPDRQVLE